MWVTFKENREKVEIPGVPVLMAWAQRNDVLFWEEEPQVCNRCGGRGDVMYVTHSSNVPNPKDVECYRCYKTGWVAKGRNNPTMKETEDARQKDA